VYSISAFGHAALKTLVGGLFSSAKYKHSAHIAPITEVEKSLSVTGSPQKASADICLFKNPDSTGFRG
jgi:hypothetical protein